MSPSEYQKPAKAGRFASPFAIQLHTIESLPIMGQMHRPALSADSRSSAFIHSPGLPALLLDKQLCFALYSASLAMTKRYKPLLAQLGLTYPQYLAMLVLWEQDGLTVSELGERLFLDSGTLTPLLKRLETSHLLVRSRDARDERRVRLTLTAQGRTLRKVAETVPERVLNNMQCALPELAALTTQLQRLRDQLGAAASSDGSSLSSSTAAAPD